MAIVLKIRLIVLPPVSPILKKPSPDDAKSPVVSFSALITTI
jgi:hypothetical protein